MDQVLHIGILGAADSGPDPLCGARSPNTVVRDPTASTCPACREAYGKRWAEFKRVRAFPLPGTWLKVRAKPVCPECGSTKHGAAYCDVEG